MNKRDSTLVAQQAVRAAEKLRVRSALNPILWLCGVTLSIGFCTLGVGFVFFKNGFPIVLYWIVTLMLVVVPLLLTGFGFVYILLHLPDMLQSEEYQLRKQELASREKTMSAVVMATDVDEAEELENDN